MSRTTVVHFCLHLIPISASINIGCITFILDELLDLLTPLSTSHQWPSRFRLSRNAQSASRKRRIPLTSLSGLFLILIPFRFEDGTNLIVTRVSRKHGENQRVLITGCDAASRVSFLCPRYVVFASPQRDTSQLVRSHRSVTEATRRYRHLLPCFSHLAHIICVDSPSPPQWP